MLDINKFTEIKNRLMGIIELYLCDFNIKLKFMYYLK
jgi:hypothetical protein